MDVETRRTLGAIDREYAPLSRLGGGGFGAVFLARKRSGRKVALKCMPMDTSDDEEYETFAREIEAVVELNRGADGGNRDMNIVYFEDWFISPRFVCIVMQYADGGTLAQEIDRKSRCSPLVPYAERRIAWYALQLCDALAFAHEKGVAHHDVKSANILIDASAGGKLLLADFGTALRPGEEAVGFTRSYASPELLASHELEDYADLRPDKVDSFALGAVVYELLMCGRLEDLSADQTLAGFITDGPGLEAAMNMGHMALPWLPPGGGAAGVAPYVGYTNELKNLVMNFLKPNAEERLLPGQLQHALRTDRLSPLLLPYVAAAQTPKPGDLVTVDNLQLGMLVQRGPDWSDGDADGGTDSVGVVVKLDGDALYVEVAFPPRSPACPVEAICCRIGASDKHELRVGPCPLPDFVSGSAGAATRSDGIVRVGEEARGSIFVGRMFNLNCAVVGVDESLGVAFAAPMERIPTPQLPKPIPWRTNESSFVSPEEEETSPPATWELYLGSFVDVLRTEEGKDVLDLFYGGPGGLKQRECPVLSIQRVQDKRLWDTYTQGRQNVSNENWGMENEIRAFLVSPGELNSINLQKFQSSGKQFSSKASVVHYKFNKRPAKGKLQMLLCRITVGRVLDDPGKVPHGSAPPISSLLKIHSDAIGKDFFACRGRCQAYPEYIINYEDRSPAAAPNTPNQVGGGAAQQSPCRSASKMCIICLERPVRYLTIPCGHPCLCEKCNSPQVRSRLKFKCPECRCRFQSTSIIYGRVVNDE